MQLSRFVKIYKVGSSYAYYHSLRMKPVYLTAYEHEELQKALKDHIQPHIAEDTIQNLVNFLVLIKNSGEDDRVLERVRSCIPKPYVSVAYFILTEQCNLACKYCFLGNGNPNGAGQTVRCGNMTNVVAEQAVSYFARQTQTNSALFPQKKEIIFYGGEPLLNFEVLRHTIATCRNYQDCGALTNDLDYSLITNGLLLNEEIIDFCIQNHIVVSVSVDGGDECSNSCRVDKAGSPIFSKLIEKIRLAKSRGLEIGLSITLTAELLDHMDALIDFLLHHEIYSISFNILMKADGIFFDSEYYEKATAFILRFHERTQQFEIFEDRFNRKLRSFVDAQVYFSDCAATGGSQIVITPNGEVGICHGCTGDGNYIIGNVLDDQLAEMNPELIRWSQITPVNHDGCLDCEALGICGGGCPLNAVKSGDKSIYEAIDNPFCIHAKNALQYLIEKLYGYMK